MSEILISLIRDKVKRDEFRTKSYSIFIQPLESVPE